MTEPEEELVEVLEFTPTEGQPGLYTIVKNKPGSSREILSSRNPGRVLWAHYKTKQEARIVVLTREAVGYEFQGKRYYVPVGQFLTFFLLKIAKS